MRICIDFDGVLADTCAIKRSWISKNLELAIGNLPTDKSSLILAVGVDAYNAMQSSVGYADTLDAEPVEGAKEALLNLSHEFEIHLLTARPLNKMIWIQAWLEKNDFIDTFSSTISSFGQSKSDIAVALGASWVVDNDSRHLVGLPRRVNGVLFGSRARSCDYKSFCVAETWADVEALIAGSR